MSAAEQSQLRRLKMLALLLLAVVIAAIPLGMWSWSMLPKSVDTLRAMSPQELERYLRTHPSDAQGWVVLGDLQLDQEAPPAALSAFRTALRLDPNSPAAGAGLAISMGYMGDALHAEAMLKDLIANAPDSPEPVLAMGRLHLRAGNPNEAQRELKRATETDPNNPEAWFHLGDLAGRLGHYGDADAAFAKAETLSPKVGRYYRVHADFKSFGNDRDGAIPLARRAVALAGWDARSHFILGKVLCDSNKPEHTSEGEQEIRQSLKMSPGWYHPRYVLALRQVDAGDLKSAATELEALSKEFPSMKEARYQLAQVYRRLGRSTDSQVLLTQYQKELREEARYQEDELQSFVKPNDAELHRRVGRYCLKSGAILGAAMHFRSILKTNPKDPEALRVVKMLSENSR